MQTHRKLKSRILSLALSAAMVTTMMPATVFAAGGGTAPGTGPVGTIQSFGTIEGYTKSVPFDGSTYAITVEQGTPFEDVVFPDTLTAMVARTTTAPAEDGDVVDSGKEDEAIPDEDDTVSGNQPASPSEAENKEIADNETPLAPEPEQEPAATTIRSEIITVDWESGTQYSSEKDGKFIYTAVLPDGYTLASGVKLPRIFVVVGGKARAAGGSEITVGTGGTHTTLKAAFDAVETGQTIKVVSNISSDASQGTLSGGKSVTLDLNGKQISSAEKIMISVIDTSSLTITDTGSGGEISTNDGEAIKNTGTGTVTVSGGTVSAENQGSYAIHNAGAGTVTVSGGTVRGNKGYAINNIGTGTVTVSGGTVSGSGEPYRNRGSAISNEGTGTVTISGGRVSATLGNAIINLSTGTVTISQETGKTTLITSANINTSITSTSMPGTIYFHKTSANKLLNITGGTVENTNTNNYSVYFNGIDAADLGTVYSKTGGTVGKVYPEVPTGGGGGSSSGGGGSSRDTTWKSVPQAYQGKTKQIGNVIVPDYTAEGSWSKHADGNWSFTGKDGVRASNGWTAAFNPYASRGLGQSAFDWFLFDANGNMLTGWFTDADGNTYYLNTNSDNTLGAMQTGWVLIDGKYYYFNEFPDGARGKLLKNTTTPDGYYVDINGVCAEKK